MLLLQNSADVNKAHKFNHWTTDSNNNCKFHVGKVDGSNVLGWKSQILTLNTDVHGFGQKKFEILKQ